MLLPKYSLFRYVSVRSKLYLRFKSFWANEKDQKSFTIEVAGSQNLSFITGKLARFADGSVQGSIGNTSVLVTAVSRSNNNSTQSFLPLTVDYREKAAAAGRIPTNYLRRETFQSEKVILSSRIIDRSIRPLFPRDYNNETQIICNPLAIGNDHDADVLSINAASVALSISDIPWNGPVGAVRIGYIGNRIIVNPTRSEMKESRLNLIIACSLKSRIVMLDGSADNINIDILHQALSKGVSATQFIANNISSFAKKYNVKKRTLPDMKIINKPAWDDINLLSYVKVKDIYTDTRHDKISRDKALEAVRESTINNLHEKYPEITTPEKNALFSNYVKKTFRNLLFESDIRCDGRKLDELRDISCSIDLFQPVHGSSLFQRGQTQVLSTLTFDSPQSALKLDLMTALATGIKEKNFFLHYEFPPYAVNETGRVGSVGRRELGHGALAEKSLIPVLPSSYPFSIRLAAEVLESNGSSSMASVCGGTLALMDAGVPISDMVAGIAIGLICKQDEINGGIKDYKILTDLLGIEDYMGDMDLKIAGTKSGITAVQADVKVEGVDHHIIVEAFKHGRIAIKNVLKIMQSCIVTPNETRKSNSPLLEKIDVPINKRGQFVGPGHYNLKKITLETGVSITPYDDSSFEIFAPNQTALDEAKSRIDELLATKKEPTLEFGAIYKATIVEVREIGVMVQLYPDMSPALVHNSQLSQRKINHPSVLNLNVGNDISVKYFGRDPVNGRMRLSSKVIHSLPTSVIKNLSKK